MKPDKRDRQTPAAESAGAAKAAASSMSTGSPNPKKSRREIPSESEMLKDVWLRMPTLDKLSNQLDSLCSRMDELESKVKYIEYHFEEGMDHIELELKEIREELKSKASLEELNKANTTIIDLVNRSKRNNIVIHNIPEGAEGNSPDCSGLVQSILRDKLGIQASMEIERAHRTPMARPSNAQSNNNNRKPRPVHVKFLRYRDREAVLKKATQTKNLGFQDQRIFISDDIHKTTREQHRRLMQRVKQMRDEGKFAFIPWSVPRVIKYKDRKDSPGPLKTMKDI